MAGTVRRRMAYFRAVRAHKEHLARKAAAARGDTARAAPPTGARALAGRGAGAALDSFHFVKEGLSWAGDGVHHRLFQGPSVPRPRDTPEPFLVVGHRGSPTEEVENTIPSCERAVRTDGANALEIDLCVTKGNDVVLYHDWDPDDFASFARQAGAEQDVRYRPDVPALFSEWRRPVCELTLDELREHYRFAEIESGDRVAAHIPAIGEFVRWAADQASLRVVFLDVKIPPSKLELVPVLVRRVSVALERHPGAYRTVYLTPEPEVRDALRAQHAEAHLALDVVVPAGIVLFPSKYSAVEKAIENRDRWASSGRPVLTLAGWWVFRRVVSHDVELRREHNREHPARRVESLIAWTVNDPAELRTLVRNGVQGILTDTPAVLRRIADKLAP